MDTTKLIKCVFKYFTTNPPTKEFTSSPYFVTTFHENLGIRQKTMLNALLLLQSLNKKEYNFVETGTSRSGLKNIAGDGASTYIFDAFVNHYAGMVTSIDIDQGAVNIVNSSTSSKTTVICNDSVQELSKITPMIDCLYIDSYDVDFLDPIPAATHALNEFLAIKDNLTPEAIIIIDDSPASKQYLPPWAENESLKQGYTVDDIQWPNGKGMLLIPQLLDLGYRLIFHEYQAIFTKK